MRELFVRLRDGGEAAFEALKVDRVEEDLQLDFKRKKYPERPQFNDEDKRTLGEALSAFSNSAGGLLVFGVDCRTGADGVDCVQGLEPISQIDAFASLTRDMVSTLLQPANLGVEVESVQSELRPGAGYVLVWVPRSEKRPHQSRATGHLKYFKRHMRSFHAMEHYDVEDAFNRVSAPELETFHYTKRYADNFDGFVATSALVIIGLRNIGEELARFPYLTLHLPFGVNVAREGLGDYRPGLPHAVHPRPERHVFTGGADAALHPGLDFPVAGIVVNASKGTGGWLIANRPASLAKMEIRCTFGCDRARATTSVITLEPQKLGFPR